MVVYQEGRKLDGYGGTVDNFNMGLHSFYYEPQKWTIYVILAFMLVLRKTYSLTSQSASTHRGKLLSTKDVHNGTAVTILCKLHPVRTS
jgi:hypothetical protein